MQVVIMHKNIQVDDIYDDISLVFVFVYVFVHNNSEKIKVTSTHLYTP